jgi:hypothetical protein
VVRWVDGQVARFDRFENGRKTGQVLSWHPNGTLALATTPTPDHSSSTALIWDEAGMLSSIIQTDTASSRERHVLYSRNGLPRTVHTTVSGRFDGEFLVWNDDAEVVARGHYRDGIQDGIWECAPHGAAKLRHDFSGPEVSGTHRNHGVNDSAALLVECISAVAPWHDKPASNLAAINSTDE